MTATTKIRKSAKGELCLMKLVICNFDPATTVYAHTGSGTNKRNDDEARNGVYACSTCHDAIDFRTRYYLSNDPQEQAELHNIRESDIERGKKATQLRLIEKGLIPK